MSQPAPPSLTVRTDGSQRTFAPGHDVVIGRDLRADVRVANPLVSRAHIVLRFDQDQGRWVAFDNGSLNGIFVDNRRVPSIDVRDGQSINLGNPDGPRLTFEVGHHEGAVGRPPPTTNVKLQPPPAGPSGRAQTPQPVSSGPQAAAPPRYPPGPPSSPQVQAAPPVYPPGPPSSPQVHAAPPARPPSAPQPAVRPPSQPQQPASPPPHYQMPTEFRQAPPRGGAQKPVTGMVKILRGGGAAPPAGAITVGRATDNDIVIPDVL